MVNAAQPASVAWLDVDALRRAVWQLRLAYRRNDAALSVFAHGLIGAGVEQRTEEGRQRMVLRTVTRGAPRTTLTVADHQDVTVGYPITIGGIAGEIRRQGTLPRWHAGDAFVDGLVELAYEAPSTLRERRQKLAGQLHELERQLLIAMAERSRRERGLKRLIVTGRHHGMLDVTSEPAEPRPADNALAGDMVDLHVEWLGVDDEVTFTVEGVTIRRASVDGVLTAYGRHLARQRGRAAARC